MTRRKIRVRGVVFVEAVSLEARRMNASNAAQDVL
jgi:hypothetical protein